MYTNGKTLGENDAKFGTKSLTKKETMSTERTDIVNSSKNVLLHIVYENDYAEDNEDQHLKVVQKCDEALKRKRMRVGSGNLITKLR